MVFLTEIFKEEVDIRVTRGKPGIEKRLYLFKYLFKTGTFLIESILI